MSRRVGVVRARDASTGRTGDNRLRAWLGTAAAGFTLLEVLVVAAILGLLAVTMLAGLRNGVHSWQKGERVAEESQRHRSLCEVLRREISGAFPHMVRAEGRTTVAFEGDHESLSLVTSAPPVTLREPFVGLRAVTLLVDRDPVTAERGLVLREAIPRPENVFDPDLAQTVMLDNRVRRIEFRYLFTDSGSLRRFQIGRDSVWITAWSGSAEKLSPADLAEVLSAIGSAPGQGAPVGGESEEQVVETFQRYFRFRLPRAVEAKLTFTYEDRGGEREVELEPVLVPIIGGARLE